MPRAVIRLGDSTSHGGKVIEATGRMTVDGIPVARVGDRCSCPIDGHDNCRIVEGDPNFLIDGIPIAVEGCKTDCNASLIPTQTYRFTVGPLGSTKVAASGPVASAAMGVATVSDDDGEESSEIVEQYYEILDENDEPVEGYAYDLFCDDEMHTRNSRFSYGRTLSVESSGDTRLVAWLIKDGADRL